MFASNFPPVAYASLHYHTVPHVASHAPKVSLQSHKIANPLFTTLPHSNPSTLLHFILNCITIPPLYNTYYIAANKPLYIIINITPQSYIDS